MGISGRLITRLALEYEDADAARQFEIQEYLNALGVDLQAAIQAAHMPPIRREKKATYQQSLVEKGLRYCASCEQELPVSSFYAHKTSPQGLGYKCKACSRMRHKEQNTLRYRQTLLKKYGVDERMYDALLKAQKYRCAICKEKKRLALDHDHETGKPRGLLCTGCNTGLGRLGDSRQGLQNALDYIDRSPFTHLTDFRE